MDLAIDENGHLTSEDNATPRDEFVLTNKAENTIGIYFKLKKIWAGKAMNQGDTYPRVPVTITRTKQP